MPTHKYFCPDCGLVLQSATDVSGKVVKCLGCQGVFTATPMNRPAAQAPIPAEPTPRPPRIERPVPASPPAPAEPPKAATPPEPVVRRYIEPPKPAPLPPGPEPVVERYVEPARPRIEDEAPPPRKRVPPPPPKSVAKVPRPRKEDPESEEIIDLAPARKNPVQKSRTVLWLVILAGVGVMCAGGLVGVYFVFFNGSSMKYQADAPDKAWTIKLPDTPETKNLGEGHDQYTYVRSGKDAEFMVEVEEKKEATPDEMFDIQAGLLLLGMAEKYKVDMTNLMSARGLVSAYDGKHPRRTFEIDTGARGKLSIQVIAANWGTSKSTIFIQSVVGKDVSNSERKAFLNSVEIKQGAR